MSDCLEINTEGITGSRSIYVYEIRVKSVHLYESQLMKQLKIASELENSGDINEKPGVQAVESVALSVGRTSIDSSIEDLSEINEKDELLRKLSTGNETTTGQQEKSFEIYTLDNFLEEDFQDVSNMELNESESRENLDFLNLIEENPDNIGCRFKVIIPLYGAEKDLEIEQEQFIDEIIKEIDELKSKGYSIIEKPMPPERRKEIAASASTEETKPDSHLSTFLQDKNPKDPIYLQELLDRSMNIVTVITTPHSLLQQIQAAAVTISILIERLIAPTMLYGTCRLKFGDEFINAIMAGSSSVGPVTVVRRLRLPVKNSLDEHVGTLSLFVKLISFGTYEPEFPPLVVPTLLDYIGLKKCIV